MVHLKAHRLGGHQLRHPKWKSKQMEFDVAPPPPPPPKLGRVSSFSGSRQPSVLLKAAGVTGMSQSCPVIGDRPKRVSRRCAEEQAVLSSVLKSKQQDPLSPRAVPKGVVRRASKISFKPDSYSGSKRNSLIGSKRNSLIGSKRNSVVVKPVPPASLDPKHWVSFWRIELSIVARS